MGKNYIQPGFLDRPIKGEDVLDFWNKKNLRKGGGGNLEERV